MSLANAARRSFTSSSVRRGKLGLEGLASKVDLGSSRVLIRLDLNVPLSKDDGVTITDDTRLRAVVPTMNFLKEQGAQVVVATHIGRPKGEPDAKFSVAPIVGRFSELLDTDVVKVDDCVGDDVAQACGAMPAGGVVLLENVRFHTGETKNFDDFAAALAGSCGATAYVNDAFGTAHRAHASTEGVVKFIDGPAAGGYLMEKELVYIKGRKRVIQRRFNVYIKGAIDDPKRPLTAILGGAKVSTKIPVIESMLDKCDNVLVGGGMIFTFYKAMGHSVGASLIEEDMVPMAKDLIAKAQAKGVNFLLPTDVVVADKFAADANYKVVPVDGIPDGWLGLDVGPATQATFSATAAASTTVVWNGPMGVFEFDAFSKGTFGVADALAANESAITIIGGGDSVAAVEKAGLADKMSHISTGGGASLELLEGKVLPGVAALDDA
ncbi:phosphoglycerate kinase [Aureococcus anophagefferens]|uniref:Phosphoglycerate kinase n=1 Tax=Aureococcus anophagefferens TaxID=44056 RepID=A0ABR1FHX1_AURAN